MSRAAVSLAFSAPLPRTAYFCARPTLWMTFGVVRGLRQIFQELKERRRLANEKPISRQSFECSHCGPLCLGRANDRRYRERSAEKRARLGHDQVGLKILPAEGRGIKVWKYQAISRVSHSRGIARLVHPGLEVSCLGWADTKQDSQHFRIAYALSQRRIETGATLLNKRKVESGSVGDGLEVVRWPKVGIGSGDPQKLSGTQTRDCLGKREAGIEIGVVRAAAIPSPPTGVNGELHEVCKTSDLLRSRRRATWQIAKMIQVDGIRVLRSQVRVDEREVSQLVLSVVVDVLVHVTVQPFPGSGERCIPTPSGDFTVLDACEFVVLLPNIRLDDFGRRQESENCCVSLFELAAIFLGQQPKARTCRTSCQSFLDERSPVRSIVQALR